MSLDEKKRFYNELLKVLSSFDQWEEERVLFDSIQSLLGLGANKHFFAVFCISSETENFPARVVWPTEKNLKAEATRRLHHYKSFDGQSGILGLGEHKSQRFFAFWPEVEPETNGQELLGFLATFFKKSLEHIHRYKELKRAKTLMYMDDVTGLYNQRKLMQDLDTFVYDPVYKNSQFALLFIDIDHFKKVNDGNGHLVGTELLVRFASLLKTGVRDGDICYRYGGDEFVIILPNIETKEAYQVAERLLVEIKNAKFHILEGQGPLNISASIGVAGYPADAQGRDDILKMADDMMYQAKTHGRGQVCHIGQYTGQKRKI